MPYNWYEGYLYSKSTSRYKIILNVQTVTMVIDFTWIITNSRKTTLCCIHYNLLFQQNISRYDHFGRQKIYNLLDY